MSTTASDSGYYRRTMARWKASGFNNWIQLVEQWSSQSECPTPTQLKSLVSDTLESLPANDEAALKAALRKLRHTVMFSLMNRQASALDLHEEKGVERALALISAFACASVQAAADFACTQLTERYGPILDAKGQPQGLLVVGMGKLGAQELNPSSDIDLIFLFRDSGSQEHAISADDYFARATRATSQLLNDNTDEGFVFRVDTRLRPHGDAGPIALSLNALEHYLQDEARAWERFAWLKAQVIASSDGSSAADLVQLQSLTKPFIYKRYLDYTAFAALRDVHAKIRSKTIANTNKRLSSDNAGWDVKLGIGGIREIEFSVQLLQLLRGGKQPVLQTRNTLQAIAAMETLGQQGLEAFPAEINRSLEKAYLFYRRIENALQWRQDEQTHWLADDPTVREPILRLLGWQYSVQVFATELALHQSLVSSLFEGLLGKETHTEQQVASQTVDRPELANHLNAFRQHRRYLACKPDTRSTIESLLSRAQAHPDLQSPQAFARLMSLFEAILGRPSYFSLLAQHPSSLERLGIILGKAQWAANYIVKHPVLLDELLDGQYLVMPDRAAWMGNIASRLTSFDEPEDLEAQLDVLREEHHAQVFRLLCQDLLGQISLEALADELSALADAVLSLSLNCLWPKVLRQFKRPLDTPMQMAAIAYGKLGGKELGYASDLDLVFVCANGLPQDEELYARLVQRLGQFLTTQTSAGHLFDIDYRLRPNGQAGVSVMSLSSFERYQREDAWLWEHQALTRARFCAGDASIGEAFERLRIDLLALPRSLASTLTKVWDMRQKIHDAHPNRSNQFDLKHDDCGMIDIEFCVQALVLSFSSQHAELRPNKGNIALLGIASNLGLISHDLAQRCQEAYRAYRGLQHLSRLNASSSARVEREGVAEHVLAVSQLKVRQAALSTLAPAKEQPPAPHR